MDDGHGIINYARPPNLPYLDSGLARECINMALGILKACRRLVEGLSRAYALVCKDALRLIV